MNYQFEEIETVECVGFFEDEYVYDLEMEDSSHTFIANDVLVHNSVFVTYKPGMVSCDWEGNPLEFIHIVSKYAVTPFFSKKLEEYADRYGVKNIQDFEMEQISKSIIFLDKKMYVKNVVWEDGSPLDTNPEWGKNGLYLEQESSIQSKGIDLVRSSTPVFARERVKEIIKYFFKNPETYSDRELLKMVRELKEQFKLAKIEDISHSSSCNNYSRGVVNDETALEVISGTHFAVKAAAFHNYLLNINPQFKVKYNHIKSGQKIKYYATNSLINEKFAYTPGAYPFELASRHAPIDYDMQFEKCILSIVNRFNKVLGLSELNAKLRFTLSLF